MTVLDDATDEHAPSVACLLATDTGHADPPGTLIDFDAYRATSWATQDTIERLIPDLNGGIINHNIRCLSCGLTGLESTFSPDGPPDPDRHGNRRYTYRCPNCDVKCTLLQARHGGSMVDQGFELVD